MGIIYTLLVLTAIAISAKFRNSDGLASSLMMFSASLATMIIFGLLGREWMHFNSAVLLIDFALLSVFVAVSLKSTQRWPMIVCAMQFLGTVSHIAGLFSETPATRILGVAQGLWAYFQCFAIISGVMYHSHATSPAGNTTTNR